MLISTGCSHHCCCPPNHQSRQEESHQQAFAQDQAALMALVGAGHAKEEEKQAHEDSRMVGEYDDAREKGEVNRRQRQRRGGGAVAADRRRQPGQLLAKQQHGCANCVDQDGYGRLPAECGEHEGDVPSPLPATISTGGAANGVSAPPMETLINSTPSVAYFKREEIPFEKKRSARIMAASVMAAGSGMNDLSKGTRVSVTT
jgi:hypothetical protein